MSFNKDWIKNSTKVIDNLFDTVISGRQVKQIATNLFSSFQKTPTTTIKGSSFEFQISQFKQYYHL